MRYDKRLPTFLQVVLLSSHYSVYSVRGLAITRLRQIFEGAPSTTKLSEQTATSALRLLLSHPRFRAIVGSRLGD